MLEEMRQSQGSGQAEEKSASSTLPRKETKEFVNNVEKKRESQQRFLSGEARSIHRASSITDVGKGLPSRSDQTQS